MRLLKRLLYRLIHWANYPTPRERLWNMYALGKVQGQKEALQAMPIAQARPYTSSVLHLPTGEWRRQWLQGNVTMDIEPLSPTPAANLVSEPTSVRDMTPEQISKVPTIQDLTEDWVNAEEADDPFAGAEKTEKMPAFVRAIHQERNAS